jgi:hypothetical protein
MRNRARAAAAVISEFIRIPPHLSLPPFSSPALDLSHDPTPRESLLGFTEISREFNVTFTPAVGDCPTVDSGSNHQLVSRTE